MRNLIRLLLMIFARTWLFLAIAAWFSGQWWTVDMCSGRMRGDLFVLRATDQYTRITNRSGTTHWSIDIFSTAPNMSNVKLLSLSNDKSYQSVLNPPGVFIAWTVFSTGAIVWTALFHHWFIVTFLIALNLVVSLVHRKRPDVQPCEI